MKDKRKNILLSAYYSLAIQCADRKLHPVSKRCQKQGVTRLNIFCPGVTCAAAIHNGATYIYVKMLNEDKPWCLLRMYEDIYIYIYTYTYLNTYNVFQKKKGLRKNMLRFGAYTSPPTFSI